jgi:hypothetical protein
MSFVGSLFGSESGDTGGAGMNYQATGPSQAQMADVWANSQSGMSQQQAFINQMNAMQNGLGNQNMVFDQAQALAGQYGQMAAGTGPSVAQNQYQQNMNQISAQTAGQIGSQKGISPALQARLIAQQGAGAQQQAAGQSATLRAQEQMNAMQGLQNQQAMMGGMANQQVAQRQGALNAYNQGANNQMTNTYGLQGGASKANAGIANTTAQGQQGLFGGLMNSFGGVMGMAHGGEVPCFSAGGPVGVAPQPIMQPAPVQAAPPVQAAANNAAAGAAPQSAVAQQLQPGQSPNSGGGVNDGGGAGANAIFQGASKMFGGLMGGGFNTQMEKAMSSMGGGGEGEGGGGMMETAMKVAPMAAAAMSDERQKKNVTGFDSEGFLSHFQGNSFEYKDPKFGKGKQSGVMAQEMEKAMPQAVMETGQGKAIDYGKVAGPILASLADMNERMKRMEQNYARGGQVIHGESHAQKMKPVPGKASVPGDSLKNDKVNAKLSPGEIIIPRSIAQAPNAPELAAQFVAAVMAKNGRMPK